MSERVYFIQQYEQCSGDDLHIKIGVSRSPERRLRELQTASPYGLRMLGYTTEIDNAAELERALHRELARYRGEGEWFWPDPNVMKAIHQMLARYGEIHDDAEPED